MQSGWSGCTAIDKLRRRVHRQSALALPAAIDTPTQWLDWQGLATILGSAPRGDIQVFSRRQLVALEPPRDLDDVRRYLIDGIGLSIRHAEHFDPTLNKLANAFAVFGHPRLEILVTPAHHQTEWSTEDDDVFVANTIGCQEYAFYETPGSMISATTLVSGDALYLPRRWWHRTECSQTSLSIAVRID